MGLNVAKSTSIIEIESKISEIKVDGIDPKRFPEEAEILLKAKRLGYDVKLVDIDNGPPQIPKFQAFYTRRGSDGNLVSTPLPKTFRIDRDASDYEEARNKGIADCLEQYVKPPRNNSTDALNEIKFPKGWESIRPQLKHNGFINHSLDVIAEIDIDSDMHLSTNELVKAVESSNFKGIDAAQLAVIYKHKTSLEELHKDDREGISLEDLVEFENVINVRNKLINEGYINVKIEHSTLIDKFKTDYRKFTKISNDNHVKFNNSDLSDQMENDYHRFQGFEDALPERVYTDSLYAHHTNPVQDISPDAIRQGTIGNCYFLASLASLAKSNPQSIIDMIKDNNNGSYTVTFPGDPKNPVTVQAPTDAELALSNSPSQYGTWASVMEKAYGQNIRSHNWIAKEGTVAEAADGGGYPHEALSLLTGKLNHRYNLSFMSMKYVGAKLAEGTAKNTPMVGGTVHMPSSNKNEHLSNGLVQGHAYSILGFDKDGPDGGTVHLRNPWGDTTVSTECLTEEFSISLKEFYNSFCHISLAL